MTERESSSIHERWAHLRFSVVGHLLAAPPQKGTLRQELKNLRRSGHEITLTVEHRAAASPPGIAIELVQHGAALALAVQETTVPNTPPPNAIDDRIAAALIAANGPVPIAELRSLCRVRKATLCARLAALTASGQLVRDELGYRLAAIS